MSSIRIGLGITSAEIDCNSLALLGQRMSVRSEHLYRQLQTFPWYLRRGQVGHRMALKDVPQHADVLEVGCGVWAFLDVLRDRREARPSRSRSTFHRGVGDTLAAAGVETVRLPPRSPNLNAAEVIRQRQRNADD